MRKLILIGVVSALFSPQLWAAANCLHSHSWQCQGHHGNSGQGSQVNGGIATGGHTPDTSTTNPHLGTTGGNNQNPVAMVPAQLIQPAIAVPPRQPVAVPGQAANGDPTEAADGEAAPGAAADERAWKGANGDPAEAAHGEAAPGTAADERAWTGAHGDPTEAAHGEAAPGPSKPMHTRLAAGCVPTANPTQAAHGKAAPGTAADERAWSKCRRPSHPSSPWQSRTWYRRWFHPAHW